MGCDIHLYSEKQDDDGHWVPRKVDTYGVDEEMTADWRESGDENPTCYSMGEDAGGSRNYWLFGLLADGVRTGWPGISKKARGLPENVSKQIQTLSDQWDSVGHNHSYWTGEELYTTMAELERRAAQSLLTEEHQMPQLRDELRDFLNQVQIANSPNERIVFWFDN